MFKTITQNESDIQFATGASEIKVATEALATPDALAAGPDKNFLSFSQIKNGSRGNDVEFAQMMLVNAFYKFSYTPGLSIDGIFGDTTEKYIKELQGHYGLSQDGIVGTDTWAKLGPVVNYNYDRANGWKKEEVIKLVQTHLSSGGRYPNAEIDGVFGPATENAIRDFQTVYGLTVDGAWGRQCWGVMMQNYA